MAKMTRRLGSLTSFRSRTPTNEQTAGKFTNMVWDYSQQNPVLPDRKPNAIVEATNNPVSDRGAYRTMNRSGVPKALHAMVGGSPDTGGHPFEGRPTMPTKTRV